MGIIERINEAQSKLPNDIALLVLEDVNKRISDWLASGGSEEDPYIEQQARFVENVAKAYRKRGENEKD